MTTTSLTGMNDRKSPTEVRLWQAVIVDAIQEWMSGPLRRKREAENFLFNDNKDFPLVCASAGMDAGCLRKKLARLVAPVPTLPHQQRTAA
jgi:hypothetical protein